MELEALFTLDEFLGTALKLGRGNSYVSHPDFSELYVRVTDRILKGAMRRPVLDIARVEAREKGKGAFTRLVKELQEKHPSLDIYVESVLNKRFESTLPKLGFIRIEYPLSPCFWLPPKKPL